VPFDPIRDRAKSTRVAGERKPISNIEAQQRIPFNDNPSDRAQDW